jgi:predicted Zn-dependent protease
MIEKLQNAIEKTSIGKNDYLETRFHSRDINSITIENGSVKNVRNGTVDGISLRVLVQGWN